MAEKENRESTHSSHHTASGSGSFGEHLDLDSIIRDILATFVVNKSGVSSNTVSDSLSAASALAKTFSTVVDKDSSGAVLSGRRGKSSGGLQTI